MKKAVKGTRKAYERHLNRIYAEMQLETVLVKLEAFTVKNREGQYCTKRRIVNYYYSDRIGELIRQFDPTQFNVGYNDYCR